MFDEFDSREVDDTNPPKVGNKEEPFMSKEFKVGDRVYRLGDGWSKAKHGEEGSVLSVNQSGSLVVQMDNGHKTPNGSSKKFALVTPRNNEGGKMNTFEINIEEQTVVNGNVITDRTTDEQLYQYITDAEATISNLEKMKAQPNSLKAKVAALKEGINGIVAICNARSA